MIISSYILTHVKEKEGIQRYRKGLKMEIFVSRVLVSERPHDPNHRRGHYVKPIEIS